MKTTLHIDATVMRHLREEAARQGRTLSELVEAGLRLILAGPDAKTGNTPLPPLPRWKSGGTTVDLADREALHGVGNGR